MQLKPFLLDQWLSRHAEPPVPYNLGGSTGPQWSFGDLLQLGGDDARRTLLESQIVYGLSAGADDLRAGIAAMRSVPAEHVLVVGGGSEALLHVFFLAAEPGANVIVPFPGFPPYHALPESLGVEVRTYQLRRDNAYRIDLDEVQRLADARTKLLLVNSPHNPTGATISDEDMQALHDFSAGQGIQFVSDEVFHPIYHGPARSSAARLPRATVIGDFSKAFALPGVRAGWLIEPDPQRRGQYLNAREYFSISNTSAGEFFAAIAVRHRDRVLGRTQEVASANLPHLERVVTEHRDIVDWVRPEGGMTAFLRLVGGPDARRLCEAAVDRGLLLTPGDCFGMPDHFRVGFGLGAGRDWFPRAMEQFSGLLRDWKGERSDCHGSGRSAAPGGSHNHSPEEERQIREAALDQTLAESFPASDPPSTDPNPDNHDALERSATGAHTHYDANYGQFQTALYQEIRREAFGEDIGQHSWITADEQDGFLNWLELSPGKTLLDVACGAGGPALRLAALTGCSIVGIDLHEEAIRTARFYADERGLGARAEFRRVDAQGALPFEDGAFDVITCIDAINHLPGRSRVIADWVRLLKPGGRVLFTDSAVVTGPLTNDEIAVRGSNGFFLFVPAGYDEQVLAEQGLRLLARNDLTTSTAIIAERRRAARASRRPALSEIEGQAVYAAQQEFLDTAARLAREGRLSRILYVAEKP